jgi:signal transduction histidine kinase
MSLSALQRAELSDKDRATLSNTTAVIDEAIRSLREISNNLSPHILNNFGLARGIKNFVDKIATMHNVDIVFSTTIGSQRYDSNIEIILYRVVCELVNNSLKHSKCSKIEIALKQSGTMVTIDYSDNGVGFVLREAQDTGMGLSNIKSRISSLGGKIRFESKPGNGMLAHIEVSTTGDKVQLAEDLYEQVYGKRYGRKQSKRSVGR